jgi:Tol biopolymer transport system component
MPGGEPGGRIGRVAVVLAICVVSAIAAPAAWAAQGTTLRVSVAAGGGDADSNSNWPSVSADGHYVAFSSWADNLVPNDTNDNSDIFVRDLQTGTTRLVSVASDGTQANGSSFTPSISADGNVIAFRSDATNLVPNDTEGHTDVFVHTMSTGQTIRVSQKPNGIGASSDSLEPSISANGGVVAFSSLAHNLVSQPVDATGLCCDIFVSHLATGHITLGDPMLTGGGASDSFLPVLSATGRYLAFGSWGCGIAKNIECLDESNVYELDMKTGTMSLVSRAYSGKVGFGCGANPAISADGTKVAFISDGANLVRGDTNGAYDVFLRDMTTGITQRVSVTSKGAQTNGGLGRVTLSGDGRYVVFQSDAWNIVPNDTNGVTDIFVHDTQTGKTFRVSVSGTGAEANGYSGNAMISADSHLVVFESDASNLAGRDKNLTTDIYGRTIG